MTGSRAHGWERFQTLVMWLQVLSWSSLFQRVLQQKDGKRRKEGGREGARDGGRQAQRDTESEPREGRLQRQTPSLFLQLQHLDNGSLWKCLRAGPSGKPTARMDQPSSSKVRPKIFKLSSAQPSCTGQRRNA